VVKNKQGRQKLVEPDGREGEEGVCSRKGDMIGYRLLSNENPASTNQIPLMLQPLSRVQSVPWIFFFSTNLKESVVLLLSFLLLFPTNQKGEKSNHTLFGLQTRRKEKKRKNTAKGTENFPSSFGPQKSKQKGKQNKFVLPFIYYLPSPLRKPRKPRKPREPR